MKRFKKILFFSDEANPSSNTLQRAVNLARENEGTLTIVDVIQPVNTPEEIATRYNIDLGDLIYQQRQKELSALCDSVKGQFSNINVQILCGIGFIEIIKLIIDGGFDLLIKVASPPRGMQQKLLGSVDLHLLRKCPCPVLIDRPGALALYSNILAAIDLNTNANGCDDQVVAMATSLAEKENATINMIHAYQLKGERMFREGRYHIPLVELNTMLQHEHNEHTKAIKTLLEYYSFTVAEDSIHVTNGEAAECIHSTAQKVSADIIVMGTLGRTGIPGYFIGNTAEEVLQTATCSILAVKPAGFESPVK